MKKIIVVDELEYNSCNGCCFYKSDGGCSYEITKELESLPDCAEAHKIYKEVKDTPFLGVTEVPKPMEPTNITFSNQHNESIGTLYWEDDLMNFKGDIHESAKILFEYVCSMWNDKRECR